MNVGFRAQSVEMCALSSKWTGWEVRLIMGSATRITIGTGLKGEDGSEAE